MTFSRRPLGRSPARPLRALAWAAGMAAALPLLAQPPSTTQAPPPALPVEEVVLDNGMRFLLVPRPEMTTVAAGWVAHVGSANEHPGTTGLTHLLEHMLFKGSETIGARNYTREKELLDEQERLSTAMRGEYRKARERFRAGEIADPYAPEAKTPALLDLEKRFAKLAADQREVVSLGELSRTYAEAGAKGMNALTLPDMTVYFVTVPAERLELWFWLESDRLLHPVLRDFYTERSVVTEERRQRTDSTPTGRFDEQLKATFWQGHPYGWPVLGWPSDLQVIDRADAEAHFHTYYGPENLTAALVGAFDPAAVKELAKAYFGRLARRGLPPDVATLEMPQQAEKRMLASCDCRPQIQVLYHTVPFTHRDTAPLEVLAGLLNGRTGRLYTSLVVAQERASSAFAMQTPMRWSGSFSFSGEAKGENRPEDLLAAWDAELARLLASPIPDSELAKVKNQITADAFRRLKDPSALRMQLLMNDAFGDWHRVADGPARALAVTAEDVKRVVALYLRPENRTLGLYFRRPAAKGAQP